MLYSDVIEDVTDQHAVIINRNREASMIMPGDTLRRLRGHAGPVRRGRRQRGRAGRAGGDPGRRVDDRRRRAHLHGRAARRHPAGPASAIEAVLAAVEGRDGMSRRADRSAAAHDLSAGGDVLERVRPVRPGRAGRLRRSSRGHRVELLNVSENATYLVTDPDAGPSVLRVHRLGYHTEPEIASELAWMDALRAEAGVRTPRVLPAADGRRVVTRGRSRAGAATRHCVRFEFLPGTEPAPGSSRGPRPPALRRAGRDHRADAPARQALGPPGLVHPVPLGYRRGVRRRGRGGDAGRTASASARPRRQVLGRLDDTLRGRLAAFGTGPERYGLVHADTRLANLLVHDGAVSVIDFDDSGFSWYLYDLGTAGELLRARARGARRWSPAG